ncbi:hypothetical protein F5Y00DRAFT_262300 [Daldinia vernicosa]|uniref:uncharacterized protein n=1 Tax=Daldinia vernicosa TaxID=114800 RepID=UPI0020075F18|nr:uncharacterized protein F5Y00DRAFT_262300 [Daldinia vernicosa]KAI0848827.1 hypothetical protein F5Y00DRAFT_262300 [Daldinia vernicosa]
MTMGAQAGNARPRTPTADAQPKDQGPLQPQTSEDDFEMPNVGATFYPGGMDDYYMPEVIAPSPQRVMPEVPENMQQGLQRMELEARSVEPRYPSSQASGSGPRHSREPSLSNVLNTKGNNFGQQYQGQYQGSNPATDYSPASNFSPFQETQDRAPQFESDLRDMRELPSFSPFPKVQGEHIPPSDEEKEAVLAESRHHVLHSNDPNMQICWARDVLSYVEIAAEAALREEEATCNPNDRELPMRTATPKIEHELRIDAINIITYLADQGHPEALFIRGKWLEFGKFGKRQDKKEAYACYSAAAKSGWGRADYRIGMLYENSNDMEKALQHYQLGLSTNDSAASYRLGMINLLGQRGQPKDIPRGLDMIHIAADTADEDAPQGAFVYGMLIARDLPDVAIPEGALQYDVSIARQYIEKAAYLGFAKAQLKMGQAYELCQLGCDFNPALSLHYYGLAARQGQPEACLGVSRWFLFGYEGTFAKNEGLAFKYAQLAAKAKLPTGEFAIGYYYEIGISVEKDLREARRWYELAADHGNKDAVDRLESLSQSKTLSKKDHETTALTRIKSKHGSQRGQRPERFKQPQNPLPALSEDQNSPRVSPHPSPRVQNFDHTDMPDPSRLAISGGNRPPAFTVNLTDRPSSAAPYPEDDRPPALSLRSKSAAVPYPEDDVGGKPQLAPHYNPGIRSSNGPIADRPGSSFGIRTQSPGNVGIRPSHSAGQLPIPPAGMDPNRGRPVSSGWGAPGQGGYRQPSPGRDPRARPITGQFEQQRPPSAGYDPRLGPGPGPAKNPGPNRLTKQGPPPGQYPASYGPRESSMPNPHAPGPRIPTGSYDQGGRGSGPSSPTMTGGLGPRNSSMPTPVGLPQGGPGGQRVASGGRGGGVPLKDRPSQLDYGRSSAPPQQAQARPPVSTPPPTSGTPASAASAPAPAPKPTSKPSQGPATFEAMGIPQGKQNDDCVVM